MRHSRKGRGRKADRIPVPISVSLAFRLRCNRKPSEPLLLRPDGMPWQPVKADHGPMFKQAADAAKLPAGATMYSLRHSSIARALLRNLPIKVVADWHDTSVGQIEKHYGKFLKHHYDDLVRAALLDTSPPSPPADVVPLRRV